MSVTYVPQLIKDIKVPVLHSKNKHKRRYEIIKPYFIGLFIKS